MLERLDLIFWSNVINKTRIHISRQSWIQIFWSYAINQTRFHVCRQVWIHFVYIFSMCKPLPHDNFRWVPEHELDKLKDEIPNWSWDDDESYFITCDITIPEEVHDNLKVKSIFEYQIVVDDLFPLFFFQEFPPCPETVQIDYSKLQGPNQTLFHTIYGPKETYKSRKMVVSLEKKYSYTCHAMNLKMYTELGCKVDNISRAIKFSQSRFASPFVTLMSKYRMEAFMQKSKLRQSTYKLLNNR